MLQEPEVVQVGRKGEVDTQKLVMLTSPDDIPYHVLFIKVRPLYDWLIIILSSIDHYIIRISPATVFAGMLQDGV